MCVRSAFLLWRAAVERMNLVPSPLGRKRRRSYSINSSLHTDIYDERPGPSCGVGKAEFSRHLKKLRKEQKHCFFDQYMRCFIPAPEVWLSFLDVKNDVNVQNLKLEVMLVDIEPRSTRLSVVSEAKEIPKPGDLVILHKYHFKKAHRLDSSRVARGILDLSLENESRMKIYSVYGRSRSKCFVVYLQRDDVPRMA